MSLDQQSAQALAQTLRDIANSPHTKLRASDQAAILYGADALVALADIITGQIASRSRLSVLQSGATPAPRPVADIIAEGKES